MSKVKLSDASALARIVRDEFRRFDGAGGAARDGRIEPSEVRSAAADPSLPASVREAASALDARPDLFEQWDALDSGGVKDGFFNQAVLTDVLGYVHEPQPAVRSPQTFKLATWNVENFFDTAPNPVRERLGLRPSEAQFREKLGRLTSVGRQMGADVLGLQEVGSREALDALAEAIDPEKFPPANRVFVDSGTPEGRNVALLTRYPVRRVVVHADEALALPAQAARLSGWKHHLLEVELDVAGKPMVVLVAHQAARANGAFGAAAEAYRRAEAAYTRQVFDRLRAEDPTRAVVVCGDMNDGPSDGSLQTLQQGDGLVDALAAVPDPYRWTNRYRPSPGRDLPRVFDHILVSPELGPSASSAWVYAGPEVARASDHRPASIQLSY
ncbi:MAG: endonuclease/exonuclease/phosphatase family protein [Archangiaceae bacterium]|nr:endonuclease/exonuclease/phosphatase family protein [Archangiaceae bacterium]